MTINNNNIFGVFTLNEARGSRLTGDWLNKESVANYGWFGGGRINNNPSIVTATVNRIDFSNDSITAQSRGSLSTIRLVHAATGNSNYGWFGGGATPVSNTSETVDRIDFSNDSATASPRGPLSRGRQGPSATGNSNYGWFSGGYILPLAYVSTVDRIDFSNDATIASPRGPLSAARYYHAATGNSNYGWFGGGWLPGSTATVNRTDFSNDSVTASPRGPLSSARYQLTATGNSNYGWFGGGNTPGSPVPQNIVDRIDFSNDSVSASPRGPLSAARFSLAATGNSNYGWFTGGAAYPAPSLQVSANVNRIDFSNDTGTISIRDGTLSNSRYFHAATSGVLNIRRQKTGNYGWFGGGRTPTTVATVDRIDFSNDTVTGPSLVRSSLSLARYSLAATGNSNYGWFGGGTPGPGVIIDRIDFSNDSVTASPRGSFITARQSFAATGNSNYGWFGGGFPGPLATVDRIDFSNDLNTASPRSPFSLGRYDPAATGNSNFGWFGGGYAAPPSSSRSRVDRIDFSNDSTTASVRGPLSSPAGRYRLAATGNSNYGWFGGGFDPAIPGVTAIVDRINFSNDLAATSARGSLSAGRYGLAATSNTNK